MTYEAAVRLAQEIRANWNQWSDLDRAAAILPLRAHGESHRKLAKIAGCSEGLIRNMEIVGRLPLAWKEALREGRFSTRTAVAAWRSQQRRQQQTV